MADSGTVADSTEAAVGPAEQPEHIVEIPASAQTAAAVGQGNNNGFVSDAYYTKPVRWQGHTVPILTQNENGPCPLLAICNVLLLLGRLEINPKAELVTYEHLVELIGNELMKAAPEQV